MGTARAPGDPAPAAQQRSFATNKAAEIGKLLELLRSADERAVPPLRAQVAQTMSVDDETEEARDALLVDLDAFGRTQRSRDGLDFRTWLSRTIKDFEDWHTRIFGPGFE